MLFDCGEDSQRQLLKQPQIVHGRVNRIFVTQLSSTNIYGIPGEPCPQAVKIALMIEISGSLQLLLPSFLP